MKNAIIIGAGIGGLAAAHALRRAGRPRTESMARFSGRLATVSQTTNRIAAGLRDVVALSAPTPLLTRAAGAAFAWTPHSPRPRGSDHCSAVAVISAMAVLFVSC